MGEVFAFAQHGGGQTVGTIGLAVIFHIAAKGAPNRLDSLRAGLLIEANANTGFTHFAQVDAICHSGVHNHALEVANFDGDGVKEHIGLHVKSHALQAFGHTACLAVHRLCNRFDAIWAVIYRIHRRDHRQKSLSGTNI